MKRMLQLTALAVALFLGRATADQPHMVTARDYLRQARDQLQKAEKDKDGHRARAVELCSQAIAECDLGIKAGRK